jgi:hypothetical protein
MQAQRLLISASQAPGLNEELQGRLSAIQLHLLHLQPDSTARLAAIDTIEVPREYTDRKLFWRARNYQKMGQNTQAEQYYRLALKRLPAHPDVVAHAADFYTRIMQKPERGYEVTLAAVQLSSFSPDLLKLYILQCLEMRLLSYAEENMDRLQYLVSPAGYQSFLQVYEAKRASVENIFSD